jgi:hypothetical protein
MKQYKPGDEVYLVRLDLHFGFGFPKVEGPYTVIKEDIKCTYQVEGQGKKFSITLDCMYDNAEDAGEASMNWI